MRKHGPAKTNVVDVARELDMSHGNVYRVFSSKKALLDAVALRWMEAILCPLRSIAEDETRPAPKRLTDWFNTLRKLKHVKVRRDPELFAAYHRHITTMPDAVASHVGHLVGQLARIIGDGIASGEFSASPKPRAAARAFLDATARFHHPAFLVLDPLPTDREAKAVLDLLLKGMAAKKV